MMQIDARRIHQPTVSQGYIVPPTDVSHRDSVENIGTQTPQGDFPVRAISTEEASPLSASSELVVDLRNKLISPKLKEDGTSNSQMQKPVGRTPSSVRNMITAFESTLAQDTRPMNSPQAKFKSSTIGPEAPLKSSESNEVKTEKIKPTPSTYTRNKGDQLGPARGFFEATPSQETTRPFELSAAGTKTGVVAANFKNELKQKEVDDKKERNSSEDLMRAAAGKTATVSGRMLPEHIGRQQPSRWFGNKRHSGGKLSVKESGKRVKPECFHEADNQRFLTDKMKFEENWKDKHYSLECPGTWIFPVESRKLCITAGGKETMNLMGYCHAKATMYLEEKGSAPLDVGKCSTHIKVNEGEKSNQTPKSSKLLNSADGELSRGPVGQAMRAVIMIGFATLVIFTRQRNNR